MYYFWALLWPCTSARGSTAPLVRAAWNFAQVIYAPHPQRSAMRRFPQRRKQPKALLSTWLHSPDGCCPRVSIAGSPSRTDGLGLGVRDAGLNPEAPKYRAAEGRATAGGPQQGTAWHQWRPALLPPVQAPRSREKVAKIRGSRLTQRPTVSPCSRAQAAARRPPPTAGRPHRRRAEAAFPAEPRKPHPLRGARLGATRGAAGGTDRQSSPRRRTPSRPGEGLTEGDGTCESSPPAALPPTPPGRSLAWRGATRLGDRSPQPRRPSHGRGSTSCPRHGCPQRPVPPCGPPALPAGNKSCAESSAQLRSARSARLRPGRGATALPCALPEPSRFQTSLFLTGFHLVPGVSGS